MTQQPKETCQRICRGPMLAINEVNASQVPPALLYSAHECDFCNFKWLKNNMKSDSSFWKIQVWFVNFYFLWTFPQITSSHFKNSSSFGFFNKFGSFLAVSGLFFCLNWIKIWQKLGSVAGPVIQANGCFEDGLMSGGLLYCVSQWTSVCTELADSMVTLGEPRDS